MSGDYPPGFQAPHEIVLALPSQSDSSAQHESSQDSMFSPAGLTPPDSTGAYLEGVGLNDLITPPYEYDMWGNTPRGACSGAHQDQHSSICSLLLCYSFHSSLL